MQRMNTCRGQGRFSNCPFPWRTPWSKIPPVGDTELTGEATDGLKRREASHLPWPGVPPGCRFPTCDSLPTLPLGLRRGSFTFADGPSMPLAAPPASVLTSPKDGTET
jgi:hypothetical protein